MKKANECRKKHLSDEEVLFRKFLKMEDGDTLWEEWENEKADNGVLDESLSARIIRSVAEKTSRPWVRKIRIWQWAAACITALGIAGATYFFFFSKPAEQKLAAVTTRERIQIVRQENNSAKDMQFVLPDHSIVLLHPRSSISYDAACFKSRDTSARGIVLMGSAYFKVAKNSRKPFTVYSGGLSTRALGTEFDVLENNHNTTIRLYKGKVAVRALKPHKGWSENVVLLPGQVVSLDNAVPVKIKKAVRGISAERRVTTPEKAADKATSSGRSLPVQCNNIPLPDVLKMLEQHYQVTIRYDEALLADKYFSGAILPDQSPEPILRIICSMQQLMVKKENPGYLIYK